MVDDIDVYRSAKLLVDQHGDEAPIHAAMRADAMLEKGDVKGAAVGRAILRAANELLKEKPSVIEFNTNLRTARNIGLQI